MMYAALRSVSPLLALLLATSAGPEAALWPPFTATISVERSVLRLGDKAFVMTRTTRRYPVMFSREVESVGNRQMPSSETVISAQIENAATPSDRRWNAVARARLAETLREAYSGLTGTGTVDPARQTSVEVAVQPMAVAPGVIAADLQSSVFTPHLMKGWESARSFLWSGREGRALAADDLFDPATGWWKALVPRMLESAYGEPVPHPIEGYETIERRQTPLIGRNGMWLKFHEEEEGSFVLAQRLCLPWEDLRPYLRKDLPFDPARLEEPPPGLDCE